MTIIPEGEPCYCGKEGCLDVYCSAQRLAKLADGKLEQFFEALKKKEKAAVNAWEDYTKYLTIAINNIHMILDCDIVLGGYVGSYIGPYINKIRYMAAERNTFGEEGGYIRACNYKVEAAALGAALNVIETFIEQV